MRWTLPLQALKPHTEAAAGPHRAPLAWLLALVVLVYANAMQGVFQFDDYNVIVDLDAVHSLSAWWTDTGQGIRPLLKLSYALNWVSGAGEAGFHAVNILVHALTVGVVYLLMRQLLLAWKTPENLQAAAWVGSALFALHPAHTEAITYVSGRSTSLMALLYLAGLYLSATPDGQTKRWHRWLVPGCFALALCIKETAVTFPLALLLRDVSCGASWKSALKKAWPSWLVLLVAVVLFGWNDAYRAAMQRSLEFNTLDGNMATQISAFPYFLQQWALPLWLNIDPDLAVQKDFSAALPGLGLLLCWLIVGIRYRKQQAWLGFACTWSVLHLLPLYLVLPRLDVANDRQLYLADWPLHLALAVAVLRTLPRRAAHAMLALLMLASATLTVLRNRDYHSELALWEQTAQVSPRKSRVHNNLGYAYAQAGRVVEARQEYLLALRLDAGNTKARLNLRRLNADLARQAAP